MDCIYIAPLSKALYNFCLSFTHTFTHQRRLAAMQGTNQLVRLGVLLRDTSTRPGWDRTGNPPTARRQLYLLSHIAPYDSRWPCSGALCISPFSYRYIYLFIYYTGKKSCFLFTKHIQRNVDLKKKKALGPTQSNDCFTEGSCD